MRPVSPVRPVLIASDSSSAGHANHRTGITLRLALLERVPPCRRTVNRRQNDVLSDSEDELDWEEVTVPQAPS
jgi:hypothetical protein